MSRRGVLGLAAALTAFGALYSCGFGDSGPPNPVPLATTTTTDPGTGGGGGSAGGPPDAGQVKRTVEWRNPLGGPPGNLMFDGDFELSVHSETYTPQVSWLALLASGMGYDHLKYETGGLCRTGLRCAVLRSSNLLYGWGTSAHDENMVGSIWAKVPEGQPCSVVDPFFFRCNYGGSAYSLEPTTDYPGDDGWCEYTVAVSAKDSALCMVVENRLSSGQVALIDSALLVPATGTAPKPQPAAQLRGARRQRLEAVIDFVRKRQRFGPPPEVPGAGQPAL